MPTRTSNVYTRSSAGSDRGGFQLAELYNKQRDPSLQTPLAGQQVPSLQ
jgi:hypothetical protein